MSGSDDPAVQQQERVNDYFRQRTTLWKDIYTGEGVDAALIQGRHRIILGWIDGLNLPRGSRVLDVGCGAGFMSVALARRGLRVHAVDAVESMVEQTRWHAAASDTPDRVSVEIGDACTLAFPDGVFDLVVALGVLPWLERPDLAIQAMARVTRPGGSVVFTAHNGRGLPHLLDPELNFALAPLARRTMSWLARRGPRPPVASTRIRSRRYLNSAMRNADLVTTRTMTHGFKFTFCERPLLHDPLATSLHLRLQRFIDGHPPLSRSLGRTLFVMARKSARL